MMEFHPEAALAQSCAALLEFQAGKRSWTPTLVVSGNQLGLWLQLGAPGAAGGRGW